MYFYFDLLLQKTIQKGMEERGINTWPFILSWFEAIIHPHSPNIHPHKYLPKLPRTVRRLKNFFYLN